MENLYAILIGLLAGGITGTALYFLARNIELVIIWAIFIFAVVHKIFKK